LRKWFGHDATWWEEFQKRYRDEIKAKPNLLKSLMDTIRKRSTVTLLYAASDEEHNNAVALEKLVSA
jgi:uncharacterized protein YeaO (DUF488 family)